MSKNIDESIDLETLGPRVGGRGLHLYKRAYLIIFIVANQSTSQMPGGIFHNKHHSLSVIISYLILAVL